VSDLFWEEGCVEAMFDLLLVAEFRLFKGYVVLFLNVSLRRLYLTFPVSTPHATSIIRLDD
jgi:hypothetical protein